MSENDNENEQAQPMLPAGNDADPEGFLHLEQEADAPQHKEDDPGTARNITPIAPPVRARDRVGTMEHLAARKPATPLDPNTPVIKQRLNALRTEVTRILTSLRWENQSVVETAQRLQPLLNVGPIRQWQPLLIPYLYEIDRGGILIPTWTYLIAQGDPEAPTISNPAETEQGRARRYAILMLGNYRTTGIAGQGSQSRFASRGDEDATYATDLTEYLGQLARDPEVSLYATQALVKQATMSSLQALLEAFKDAQGWAKVDTISSILEFKQERFYDLILASAFDNVTGLESYVSVPIYRAMPLANYLSNKNVATRLKSNTAQIFQYILQESATPPLTTNTEDETALPPLFARHFPSIATALLQSAQYEPHWQYAVALHYLGIVLGRYWGEINQENIKDARIIEPIYQVLPLMNEVERWMNGPGRDVLLQTIADPQEKNILSTVRVLGDLRDPRATNLIIQRIETIQNIENRAQALTIGALCDTLGRSGEQRAATPLYQLLMRTVDVARRNQHPKRKDNLPAGDANIPGSIVYAAIIHACGLIGDRTIMHGVWDATQDLDPYVRTQALEALRQLDPEGSLPQSKHAARNALNDPRETIVRLALQLILQYADMEAISTMEQSAEEHPELASTINDTIRQLS
ncbi:HEAT repeat domain-containing protein [Dictyobacter arantiisoli]|uniref:HEAT repeat domain-containing protein n=1 Tax=Dictyobacter arantiisoli TaxID=2014874 RepID=A0A5A5T8R2_9CHLR|nr:hypothetical protein [Dictyobacter arantiisoli]GCF07788.1 hypothetical protein KDI_13520 [Dictyobacter arantiisoli]